MSRPELTTVEYHSLPGSAVRKRLRAMDSSWNLALSIALFLIAAGYLIPVMLSANGSIGSIVFVLVLTCAALYLGAKDQIEIGEHGLSFPVSKVFSLRLRTLRLWSDVEKVELVTSADKDASVRKGASHIDLTFKSGGSVSLRLADFSKDGLCTFLSGLQQWSSVARDDRQLEHWPLLFEYESGEKTVTPEFSYTKFWERELQNTYTFTTFVPLQGGQLVRNGSLRVREQIAAGGFSAIYLVEDNETGDRFVLKEAIVPSSADNAAAEKIKSHFRREAEILVKLDHPSIAKVYDHFVEQGRHYLLLEYIDGEDIRNILGRRRKCDEHTCAGWAYEVATVLMYLHTQSPPVVHRDITPDNMVLSSTGKLVVIDFGAANSWVGEATGTLVGKQSYMAPEQIRGKATPQSDIYSLGASMFFFLTGTDPEPLATSNIAAVRSDVSRSLLDLMVRTTQLEARERIGSAEEVQTELAKILSETRRLVDCERSDRTDRTDRTNRSNRTNRNSTMTGS